MTPMRKISPMNQSADLLTKSRRSDRRDPPRGASGRTVMDAHSLIHRDVPSSEKERSLAADGYRSHHRQPSEHDAFVWTPQHLGTPAVSVARLPGVLTVPEAAAYAAVSAGTLRKEIKNGNLRARRIGRCIRILDEDLAAWLRTDGSTPSVEATR